MSIFKKILFLGLMLMLTACAQTRVSVSDHTAVGHSNIHVVFIDDELDDPLDVGSYLIDVFLENGVTASREVDESAIEKNGSGSGFIVADGYWVTNHHVIDGAKKITVKVGGASYPAKVVDSDKFLDLALLKASTGNLRPFNISEAKVGEDIYAIGYPVPDVLGARARITSGIVSSLRGLNDNASTIQITAPIQPGNSGGPIVTKKWNIAGVAVSTASTVEMVAHTGGTLPQGLNFAVAPNHLKGFLMQNGVEAQGPFVSDMSEAIASSGLIWIGDDNAANKKRIYIARYRYRYHWEMMDHIRSLTIKIVDAQTGKTILTSKTDSPNLGVRTPVEQAAEDILIKLGLKAAN